MIVYNHTGGTKLTMPLRNILYKPRLDEKLKKEDGECLLRFRCVLKDQVETAAFMTSVLYDQCLIQKTTVVFLSYCNLPLCNQLFTHPLKKLL